MSETEALRPVLSRYPDARRGIGPLIEPILFPYLGLIFGFGAALAGTYNAWMLRRPRLMLLTILIGLLGCLSFLGTIVLLPNLGVKKVGVALIVGRALHFFLGGLLFAVHRPHFRGHQFQNGATVPVLPSYLASIALSTVLPWRVTLALLGGLFVG